jgi:hypothetical protein
MKFIPNICFVGKEEILYNKVRKGEILYKVGKGEILYKGGKGEILYKVGKDEILLKHSNMKFIPNICFPHAVL